MAAETRLLDRLIHELVNHEFEPDSDSKLISAPTKLMLQSIGVSIHSILKLTEAIDMAIKDCFGIARCISEMSINVGYIVASDAAIAKRAQQHALQKTYRDLQRSETTGEMKFEVGATAIPNVDDVDGLKEALDLFTDRKGREIRQWSPQSLDQKIKAVGSISERAAYALAVSKFAIYRHSSELLHGSYFGVSYFWMSPSGKRLDRDGFEKHWVEGHLTTIFTAAFFGAIGAVEACATKFEYLKLMDEVKHLEELALKTLESYEANS